MLNAITPAQVGEIIALLEQLTAARKVRVAQGRTQTADEIINEPERRRLTDYLYGLSDDARKELIALMLLGRGDFDHSYQSALETCSKYTDADDQVIYLMGKTVEAVARQPELRGEILSLMFLGLALTEAIVFYALLMGFVAFFIG